MDGAPFSTRETAYGSVGIGGTEALFAAAVRIATQSAASAGGGTFRWALTGGSTPKAWYRWCVERGALSADVLRATQWLVSDERCVPLESPESNFGTAARALLDPLGIGPERRQPWPVHLAPAEAAVAFAQSVPGDDRGRLFSLCFLGLGDDAHTASLFPGSPLLGGDGGRPFAAVEVPGKGWRLTITPHGLARCEHIVVMATGAAKAAAVRRVFRGGEAIADVPAKVLGRFAPRVTWLLDEPAAAGLAE